MLDLLELLKRLQGGQNAPTGVIGTAQTEEQPQPAQSGFNPLSHFLPDDADKRDAISMALLNAGAGMMAAGGPSATPTNFLSVMGTGLGTGAQTYTAARKDAEASALDRVKTRNEQVKLLQAQADAGLTDDIKEYRFYVAQTEANGGKPLEFNDWMNQSKKAGATNVTVEGNKFGTIPAGFQLVEGNGTTRLEPIPGSPQAEEQRLANDKRKKASDVKQTYSDVVTSTIDDIFTADREATLPTTGLLGSVTQNIPGTNSHDISQNLKTLKANASFERLNAMREASPTGGALGGVSEKEMALLEASYAALEQSQSDEQFKRNLNRFHNTYLDIVHGREAGSQYHRSLDYGLSEKKEQTKPSNSGGVGLVITGDDGVQYRFKGGDKNKKENWEPIL